MVSINRKRAKTALLIFLILIVLVLIGLTFYYSGYIEVFGNIVNGQKTEKDIMMSKAAEFVENGIPFEMAPKELRDHHFFKVGYEVALRRQRALQMQENKKIGGR